MDPRVSLLREYYGGLPMDRAKVETREHGFAFLERLQEGGLTLDYGELTLSGLLHKYRLSGIPPARMDALLHDHVEKRCNVCLYFADGANRTFCFNLDNNHKTDNTQIIPEMALAMRAVRGALEALGCPPLVLASGRGYHLWCRLSEPVDNTNLYAFMRKVSVGALAAVHAAGLDHRRVKVNVYPDRRTRDTVSLRLFGSDHAKNRVFSRVVSGDGLLDEAASWAEFERHLREKTIAPADFLRAFAASQEPGFMVPEGAS